MEQLAVFTGPEIVVGDPRSLQNKISSIHQHGPSKLQLRKCVGSVVAAMGPEKLLALLPISPGVKDLSYSNVWLLPVLKEYVIGSSLKFFMEHILPLEVSLNLGSHKVIGQDLQTGNIWELLPAFCRYPTDISKSFRALAKNLKTLASCSEVLLQASVDVMFELYPKKHGYLKDAVGCLASITESSILKNIFNSSLKRLIVINDSGEYGLLIQDKGSDDNTETHGASALN